MMSAHCVIHLSIESLLLTATYQVQTNQHVQTWKLSGPLDADPIDGVRGLKRKKKRLAGGGLSAKKSHLSLHPLDQHLVVLIGSFQVCTG